MNADPGSTPPAVPADMERGGNLGRGNRLGVAALPDAAVFDTVRPTFFGPVDGRYDRVPRREVAERIVLTLEHVARQARSSRQAHRP